MHYNESSRLYVHRSLVGSLQHVLDTQMPGNNIRRRESGGMGCVGVFYTAVVFGCFVNQVKQAASCNQQQQPRVCRSVEGIGWGRQGCTINLRSVEVVCSGGVSWLNGT